MNWKTCDVCGKPFVRAEDVYTITTSVTKKRPLAIQEQQRIRHLEVHGKCIDLVLGYIDAYQRGMK